MGNAAFIGCTESRSVPRSTSSGVAGATADYDMLYHSSQGEAAMSSPLPASLPHPAPRRQRFLDGFAVTASLLCLIHCLLLPMLLVALPVLATMLVVPEAFHAVAFFVALPTSTLAMVSGRARHGRHRPAMLAAAGLILLGLGAFAIDGETAERIVTSIGAVTLAVAHGLNWRARSARCMAPSA